MLLAHTTVLTQLEPWLIISAGLVGVAWLNKRGLTGDAVDYLQKANKILHDENRELKKECAELLMENAALHSRTDFAEAFKPLMDQGNNHERRADERSKKTLIVLDLIAQRLGKDENGEHDAGGAM